MSRSWLTRSLLFAALQFFVVIPVHAENTDKLQQQFRYMYLDKTLLLRNFYSGDELSYGPAGELTSHAMPGDWTVDGVVKVNDLSLKHQQLNIQARRLYVAWYSRAGFQYLQTEDGKKDKKNSAQALRIQIDFGPDKITVEKISAALSQVFLTDHDSLAGLVPNYWKACILAAITGTGNKQYDRCRFSPEFTATPGVVFHSEENPKFGAADNTDAGEVPRNEIMYIGKNNGITAPKAVFAPDPRYSDEARRMKYQGTALLGLVVDKAGNPRTIRIKRPLGCGLDEQAVNALTTWKFNPAMKDGQPVAVEIVVEVDFRLPDDQQTKP